MNIRVLGKLITVHSKKELIAVLNQKRCREFDVEEMSIASKIEIKSIIGTFTDFLNLIEAFPAYTSLFLSVYAQQFIDVSQEAFKSIINAPKEESLESRLVRAIQSFPQLIQDQRDLLSFLEKFPTQGENLISSFKDEPNFSKIIYDSKNGIETFIALIKYFPAQEINLLDHFLAYFLDDIWSDASHYSSYIELINLSLAYPDRSIKFIKRLLIIRELPLDGVKENDFTPPTIPSFIRLLQYYPEICSAHELIYILRHYAFELQDSVLINIIRENLFSRVKQLNDDQLLYLAKRFKEHSDELIASYLEALNSTDGQEFSIDLFLKRKKFDLDLLQALQLTLNASDQYLLEVLNCWLQKQLHIYELNKATLPFESLSKEVLVKCILEKIQHQIQFPDGGSLQVAIGNQREHLDAIIFLHNHFPTQFEDGSLDKALKFWLAYYFCARGFLSTTLSTLFFRLRMLEQPYRNYLMDIIKNDDAVFNALIHNNSVNELMNFVAPEPISDITFDINTFLIELKAKVYVESFANLADVLESLLIKSMDSDSHKTPKLTYSANQIAILNGGSAQIVAVLEYVLEKLNKMLSKADFKVGNHQLNKASFKAIHEIVSNLQDIYAESDLLSRIDAIMSCLDNFRMPSLFNSTLSIVNRNLSLFPPADIQDLPIEIQGRIDGTQTPIYQDLPDGTPAITSMEDELTVANILRG